MMSLAQAIRETGLSETAIRHYESRGLINASRGGRGTILVTQRSVDELHIIAAAREIGFSVEESGYLLEILRNRGCPPNTSRDQLHALLHKKRCMDRLLGVFGKNLEAIEIILVPKRVR